MYSTVGLRFIISAIAAIAWIAVFSLVLDPKGYWGVTLFDMSTNTMPYPLTIQNIMWVAFFFGLGELLYRHLISKEDFKALNQQYLLEEEGLFYDQEELAKVMRKVNDKPNRLARLVKSLFIRYQASQKSPNETHEMLNSQLEMMQFKIDVDYNMLRFTTWFIPTLGFVGTVMGIARALEYVGRPGSVESDTFLTEMTSQLAVAFNTTLVALLMSAILVYLMHIMQGREEQVIQHCGEYCLDNFVNRLISK